MSLATTRSFKAHVAPFFVFALLLGTGGAIEALAGDLGWKLAMPSRYWVFPLQTVVCGALLWWFWPCYRLGIPAQPVFTLGIAALVLALWISPQELLGAPRRYDGFDPYFFGAGSGLSMASLAVRFVRLVIVVPLMEEIFWRGFLLRYLINDHFENVPLGTFSWKSFGIVTACFGFAHWGPDFWPAIATGMLYNYVVYRTRSLSSCVLAHAVTNLLLGVYILRTGQWGFW